MPSLDPVPSTGQARAEDPDLTARPAGAQSLVLLLIRPSKYDDDGYVIRHFRGTLPSNTLACLTSLARHVAESGALGDVALKVRAIDETVTRVKPAALARRYHRSGARVLVGLVGVQTNQMPRAHDLAREFRRHGCDVMIGGFHVSGAIRLAPSMPPECQALLDDGVVLVLGEVEEHFEELLRDAARGALRPIYDWLDDPPRLEGKPLPRASREIQKRFVLRASGTIDAGRGCPFFCSFCTIVTVQGRKMRARKPEDILAQVRENYHLGRRRGVRHYFFTDDNFSRHPAWEEIFDGLIAMREQEGLRIEFMMQVDTAAARIPRFVEKAARAGCVQVFIGVESLREENLRSAGKRHNRVAQYREMIARWHAAGVVCHAGFIIGFPNDTYESIMEDVRALREELLVDQASFFMLTPLPGSADHRKAVEAGIPLDEDYNRFDSFHATMPHPRMSAGEWGRAFRDAWKEFYDVRHMRAALLRQNPHTYWALFKNFIWYRAAMLEGAHPMITGFFRRRSRSERRPSAGIEPIPVYLARRVKEIARICRGYLGIVIEMQQLWVATRIRRSDYRRLGWSADLRAQLGEVKLGWVRLHQNLADTIDARWAAAGAAGRARLEVLRGRTQAIMRAAGVMTERWSMASVAPRFLRESHVPHGLLERARHAIRTATSTIVFLRAMATERY